MAPMQLNLSLSAGEIFYWVGHDLTIWVFRRWEITKTFACALEKANCHIVEKI